MPLKKSKQHSPPYRTMMELADIFADEKLDRLDICYMLTNARAKLGIDAIGGYQQEGGPKYSYEQQLEIVKYNNSHPPKNSNIWKELPIEVLVDSR